MSENPDQTPFGAGSPSLNATAIDLGPALASITLESIRPLTGALAAICACIGGVDWLSRDTRSAALLSLTSMACAAALLWLRAAVPLAPPDLRRAHAIFSGVVALILALLFARSVIAPGPTQAYGVALVMFLSGFFLLSPAWLAALLGFAVALWLLAIAVSSHRLDAPTAILFLSAVPLSLVVHVLRIRILGRENSWRRTTECARENAERSMRALRESEERMRSVLEASLDAVISADELGVITGWNGRAAAMLGWSSEEVIGRSVGEVLVPPELRAAHERGLHNLIATGRSAVIDRRIEFEVLHRDGHRFLAEIAISVARQRDGRVLSAFIRDITQRRAMEEALREEAQVSATLARIGYELIVFLSTPGLLRRLCELTAEVLDCEISNTFLFDRESATYLPVQTYGHTRDEWAAIQSLEFRAPEAAESFAQLPDETVVVINPTAEDAPHRRLLEKYGIRSALVIALRRGSELIGVQTAARRRDGSAFTASQLRLARDLAQIASLALDNARLFEEAERSSRVKSEFVATMSHELRTPLNVILGYNELLLAGAFSPLTGEQSEMLQRSNCSALQLRELITATLDMSRLEAGRMELDLEEVDLAELARDIDSETQPFRADKPEIELRWQIAGDLPRLSTDRSKLKVTLKNLVTNAVKFTDQGSVTVVIEPCEDGVAIRVTDTGIGIPPDSIQAIFEPFQQADGSSTRRHGGVGLGLYIVRRLLEMLGASIDVSSEVGRGTTFRIRLRHRWPAAAPGRNEATTVSSEPSTTPRPSDPPRPFANNRPRRRRGAARKPAADRGAEPAVDPSAPPTTRSRRAARVPRTAAIVPE